MNKRPTPAEVQDCFIAPLDDATLLAHLTLLRADPNWTVLLELDIADVAVLALVYSPSGEHLDLRLERGDRAGHVTWQCV